MSSCCVGCAFIICANVSVACDAFVFVYCELLLKTNVLFYLTYIDNCMNIMPVSYVECDSYRCYCS